MSLIIGRRDPFTRFAQWAAKASGHPATFMIAAGLIVLWAVTGPVFHYSDTWQLAINTTTTVITFLMVFLIQNTQNRDTQAIHLKLDELIRSHEGAHTALLDLEELSSGELARFQKLYLKLAKEAREELRTGKQDTDVPSLPLES
jgi:low affinity Fe/Cu permease